MTKREYLRNLGFEVGERGRFNDAMKHALESYEADGGKFEDPASKNNYKPPINFQSYEQTPLRPSRKLVGHTSEGYLVGFVTCRQCAQHMTYCNCPGGILAPSIVITSKEPDVRVA